MLISGKRMQRMHSKGPHLLQVAHVGGFFQRLLGKLRPAPAGLQPTTRGSEYAGHLGLSKWGNPFWMVSTGSLAYLGPPKYAFFVLFGPKAPFGANDTFFCLSAFLHILLFCETRMKTKRRHCPTQRRHSPTKKRHLPTTFWQDVEAALLKGKGSFWSKRHNIAFSANGRKNAHLEGLGMYYV